MPYFRRRRFTLARVGTKRKNILILTGNNMTNTPATVVDLLIGTDTATGDANTTPVLIGGRVKSIDLTIEVAYTASTFAINEATYGFYVLFNPNNSLLPASALVPYTSVLTTASYKNNIMYTYTGIAPFHQAGGEPKIHHFRFRLPVAQVRNNDRLQLVINSAIAPGAGSTMRYNIHMVTIWYY